MGLHIVLFEPEIPQNTGNIARTCAALHATLHLVHPLGFTITDRKLKRAGLDYWHLLDIQQHTSISAFMDRYNQAPLWFFTTKAHQIYSEVTYGEDAFLIFGKETAGIDEALLVAHADRCIRIPMYDDARSLNLSNSVAIGAYEFERQHHFSGLLASGNLHRLSWPQLYGG
ncbi:MAG: tRNA (cytidine(34)-2'-O)-methyltransferase [Sphaerochaetaceae bacterium]|nr:tRNA (cytidine(34)-2'-O)-methyltransferase [Sphaerochaetaceae bacterium]MDD3366363.1 tRNA (cytidine(34)-2'-O)-methyltransferase [Sphaerochaetaceae bacterium]MDD4218563.1 tRNA (cytidine(34)-2'-O)-methyltransferase [Sphaerochaetaceae bacterium]MDY0371405.1 tRNA (cytidine(34)-2'-O)-methyltransferase [Sphaerochaetaceae bacterium]